MLIYIPQLATFITPPQTHEAENAMRVWIGIDESGQQYDS